MIRYYLLATLIVVAFGSIIFARRLAAPDLRISAQPTGTPTVESPAHAGGGFAADGFSGEGPWVLSALPGCFDEQSRATGPLADLRGKLPDPRLRIPAGTKLTAGACTLLVRPHEVWVTRGSDRLRVPPDASLYRVGGRLTLVVRTGSSVEIRRY